MSIISPNLLLTALPSSCCDRLNRHLEEVTLVQGQILHQANKEIDKVYFPLKAVISLVMVMSDKSTTEVGIVGYRGMVGLPAVLGGQRSPHQAVVQVSGKAIAIDSEIIQSEFNRGEALQRILLLYTQAQMAQISQIAACQTSHPIQQRLARWLLLTQEAMGESTIPVTQKLISTMLGVRRASITEAAISLQQAGIIAYSRGQIQIVQPHLLKQVSCECHSKIQQEYDRLLALRVW